VLLYNQRKAKIPKLLPVVANRAIIIKETTRNTRKWCVGVRMDLEI